jgi:hypothetical protein
LQVFQHYRQDREDSAYRKWPRPSETEQQCEKEIADEVIELKAKARAWCPFRGSQRETLQTFNISLTVIL